LLSSLVLESSLLVSSAVSSLIIDDSFAGDVSCIVFLLLFVPVVESDAFVSVWAAKALRLAGDFVPSVLTAADQGLLITLFSPNFVPMKEKSRASQYNLFFVNG